jgi:hypothetical protein
MPESLFSPQMLISKAPAKIIGKKQREDHLFAARLSKEVVDNSSGVY